MPVCIAQRICPWPTDASQVVVVVLGVLVVHVAVMVDGGIIAFIFNDHLVAVLLVFFGGLDQRRSRKRGEGVTRVRKNCSMPVTVSLPVQGGGGSIRGVKIGRHHGEKEEKGRKATKNTRADNKRRKRDVIANSNIPTHQWWGPHQLTGSWLPPHRGFSRKNAQGKSHVQKKRKKFTMRRPRRKHLPQDPDLPSDCKRVCG